METTAGQARISSNVFGRHRHICAFFNSVDEQHRVLRPFIRDGFADGDKAYHYVDPRAAGRTSRLARRSRGRCGRGDEHRPVGGAAVAREHAARRALRPGDLAVHVRGGAAVRAGVPDTGRRRFFGHMEWALTDLPGTEDLIEYETRVNDVIPKYEDTVICTYDLTKFGASAVMDALRTHPVVIIGGLLQENPFYVSPDQLLSEIRERRSARKSARRGALDVRRCRAELVALRTVLRDLVALSAIPAAWVGREPAAVAAGLADTLIGLLRLDFVYVRLCVPGVAAWSTSRAERRGRPFRDGWKVISPKVVGSRLRRSFPTSTAVAVNAVVSSFPLVSTPRAEWSPRPVTAPISPPRLTSSCSTWPRITPRRLSERAPQRTPRPDVVPRKPGPDRPRHPGDQRPRPDDGRRPRCRAGGLQKRPGVAGLPL